MNRSGFGGSPFTPRGRGGGGFRGRAQRFSPLVDQSLSPGGRLPDFTPSPRGGRGGWGTPRGSPRGSPRGGGAGGWGTQRGGRGFGTPRGRGGHGGGGGGGGGGLFFDEAFVRFATENPWAELEQQKGLKTALGPLNSGGSFGGGGGGGRPQSGSFNNSPASSPAPAQQQSALPVPDDDDSFV